MYTCSNCGTSFDGGVCPNCCTMRPTAAVLGSSGRILRSREASAVPPQEQAERFAEELEYSRKADAWRRQQKKHAEDMRRRAAELAAAAERQQEQPVRLTEEEQRYARQAEKAVNWHRKAPGVRAALQEDVETEMPDALRSLKIDSRNPDKPVTGSGAAASVETDAGRKNVPSLPSSRAVYPFSPQAPALKGTGRVTAGSEKIDAAWRSFARGEAASGQRVQPRFPRENERSGEASVPRPPLPPAGKNK